jgi:hypothetical protein
MFAVVVFEPAMPHENISLESQVQQVFGPFKTDADADNWVTTFRRRCGTESMNGITWRFLVIDLSSPNAIPTDPNLN